MSGFSQNSTPPLIPGSGMLKTLEVDRLNVDILNATDAIFTTTVHDSLEVANTITCNGTVLTTQVDGSQYLFNSQSIDGSGITKDALYTGSETPFGDKLFYKAPNDFYQLITPLVGTGQFTNASSTIVLNSTDGVGLVHSESRFVVTPTASTSSVSHMFLISITQNTVPFVSGTNFPGNGTVTITIIPSLGVGETLDFNWHLDGRLKLV